MFYPTMSPPKILPSTTGESSIDELTLVLNIPGLLLNKLVPKLLTADPAIPSIILAGLGELSKAGGLGVNP